MTNLLKKTISKLGLRTFGRFVASTGDLIQIYGREGGMSGEIVQHCHEERHNFLDFVFHKHLLYSQAHFPSNLITAEHKATGWVVTKGIACETSIA
jgi:hypothetical protein